LPLSLATHLLFSASLRPSPLRRRMRFRWRRLKERPQGPPSRIHPIFLSQLSGWRRLLPHVLEVPAAPAPPSLLHPCRVLLAAGELLQRLALVPHPQAATPGRGPRAPNQAPCLQLRAFHAPATGQLSRFPSPLSSATCAGRSEALRPGRNSSLRHSRSQRLRQSSPLRLWRSGHGTVRSTGDGKQQHSDTGWPLSDLPFHSQQRDMTAERAIRQR
jgi:hypothetical protein